MEHEQDWQNFAAERHPVVFHSASGLSSRRQLKEDGLFCTEGAEHDADWQVTDEEVLHTVLCEAEAIINGRPITKASPDLHDLEALTPNHLLLLKVGNVGA